MQLLCSLSHEHGTHKGFNWIEADVLPFPETMNLPVPHMGWNEVHLQHSSPLLEHIEDHSDFYFVHSFYVQCKNTQNILATTQYGTDFASIIQNNNVIGMQFHPEKSQSTGLQLLNNFIHYSC